jgi:serine/threonine-protein kinase HipA
MFGPDEEQEFRISIAGAQEKTALLRLGERWCIPQGATPTTHILKLPLGLIGNMQANMKESVENEWLCLRFLGELGLPVAQADIAHFEDEIGRVQVLVVKRFDREFVEVNEPGSPWIVRLPQEDMCQASGTPPERKYESDGGPGISKILGLLQGGLEPAVDALAFIKSQLAFWLLAAPDGHAKNFSIFLKRQGYSMTPLYDVLSAWPIIGRGPSEWAYQKASLAMAVRGSRPYRQLRKITTRHWEKLALSTAVPDAFRAIVDVVERSSDVLTTLEAGLPESFPAHVWERIAGGVRRHRDQFLDGLKKDSIST